MANEFYDHTTYPATSSTLASSPMRSELDAVEAGFDKLPTMAGNGGEIVAVNSGATALEAITTTGTGSGVRATSPTLVTPNLGTPTVLVGTNITGTAAGFTAGSVSNLAGGSAGNIPYQSGAGATGFSAAGTAGQALVSGGTGAPTWTTGTLALAGNFTTSGAHAVTFTFTGVTGVTFPTTGTLATLAGSETLTNKGINGSNNTLTNVPLTTAVTGTLPVANGGTGIATTTAYSPVFSGTTATGAFQASLGPGTSGEVLTSAGAGALPTWSAASSGKFKELVYVAKTDTFSSATTGAWTSITGVVASTTTSPAVVSTDKVLITVTLAASSSVAADRVVFRVTRDGTAIGIGDAASSRIRATAGFSGFDAAGIVPISFQVVDEPADTSAHTYQVQFNSIDSVGTFYINRSSGDDDAGSRSRGISTITLARVGA